MLRRTLLLLATGLATALALPAASAVAAPDTVIDFSAIPNNATVLDQYANVGVRFGNPSRFGFPAPPDNLNCGTPYGAAGQLNGTALGIACASGPVEFPDRRFATAIEFSTERRRVQFNIVNRTPNTQTASIKFYAIGSSTPLTTITSVLTPGNVAPIDYNHGATNGGIVGVGINGVEQMDWYDSGGVFIDDIRAPLDDVPPPAKYSLALQQPSAEVVEGATVEVPVSVRRYNGSSGPVTLAVGTPPSKIASTEFSPSAAVTGSDPATLRITAARPFTGTVQLPISATGGGSAGTGIGVTSLLQSVTGIPAVYFATGGRFPLRLVPGCGKQEIADSFNVRGGFDQYTSYNFGAKTGGLQAETISSSVFPKGDGTYPIGYKLDPGAADGGGTLEVRVNPYGATPAGITLNWITDRLTVDSVLNPAPALPLRDGGSTVAVVGNFPAGCPVTFKDSADHKWSIRTKDSIEVDGRRRDHYLLNLPSTAVSGPLRALNDAGVEMARTKDIDVREYRRTYGFSMSNSSDAGSKGTYSWADFERTFGDDDTDACFIVCVHDPIASDYYDQIKADVEAGTGLCFGYATLSARFRGYGSGQRFSDYQQNATRAWDIMPVTDGTPVKRDIVRWFTAQQDKSFVEAKKRNMSQSPAEERKLLKDLLAEQGAALISIRQDGSGHAIIAYGVRDTGDGGMILSTYDSNRPYDPAEQTNSATRADALTKSEITVMADGSWSGGSVDWKGDNSTLVVNSNLPPVNANLPSTFSLASLFSSTDGSASPATVTGIESGGKPQLDSDGEPVAGSSVDLMPLDSGKGAIPQYELQKGREYELTIKGTNKGSYDHSLLAGGAHASVRGVDTKPGQVDHVTIRPGQASLRFATGAGSAPVTYDLLAKSGKATRTASIAMTAREGGDDEAELSGGVLRLAHDGPATKATITLGSVGEGLPGSVQTAPMSVGRDQRIELKPRSWRTLSGGVGYVVKAKGGRVVRRGTVRLRTSTKVAVGSVKAKRKGKKLTVTGRVTKRGSAPVLVASATVVKGGKVLRRKTATLRGAKVKKGRFSLPVTVGSVPRGARVKVEVLLLDEAAGLATARKTVTVR
jgi:hypothetical protein